MHAKISKRKKEKKEKKAIKFKKKGRVNAKCKHHATKKKKKKKAILTQTIKRKTL